MKAKCCQCKKEYKELDEESFYLIQEDVPMICYECIRQMNVAHNE